MTPNNDGRKWSGPREGEGSTRPRLYTKRVLGVIQGLITMVGHAKGWLAKGFVPR